MDVATPVADETAVGFCRERHWDEGWPWAALSFNGAFSGSLPRSQCPPATPSVPPMGPSASPGLITLKPEP